MKRLFVFAALAGLCSVLVPAAPAEAGDRRHRSVEQGPQLSEHPNAKYYRGRGPQVRAYVKRRGGYSYSYSDSVVEFRDLSILRDYQNARSQGGPFDSGFFFDSGINRHNESPNLN